MKIVANAVFLGYSWGMFGLFNINKAPGPTSHDIVARVRRMVGRKVKVGHAGTLDPFAAGVLVVCVGKATRLASYVQDQPKRYLAWVTLAATSTTDDPEGEITPAGNVTEPTESQVREVLKRFVGEIQQIPPAHSAVHVNGQRAYKLARKGEKLSLTPRTVNIHSLDLLRYDFPLLEIDVRCGSGTYIRSLARDIGQALGTGGYCSKLTRTAVGCFRLENAVGVEELNVDRHLLPPTPAIESLPKVTIRNDDIPLLADGKIIEIENSLPPNTPQVALLDPEGQLIAIAKPLENLNQLQPTKVFYQPTP